MSRLKRLTAIIMAPVLGCTVLTAPGVAAAAEETTDLKMNCFIKQGPAKSYSNDVNGAYSQAWVWQLAEYDFSMSLTADAPATAVVGQPVTYSIKSSQVTLSNPIKWVVVVNEVTIIPGSVPRPAPHQRPGRRNERECHRG